MIEIERENDKFRETEIVRERERERERVSQRQDKLDTPLNGLYLVVHSPRGCVPRPGGGRPPGCCPS